MSLILENLRMKDCEITVDVGDTRNNNGQAKLTFAYDLNGLPVSKSIDVTLRFPPESVNIPPTPRDGIRRWVIAKLENAVEEESINNYLTCCNQ